jgi:hypothetical protein
MSINDKNVQIPDPLKGKFLAITVPELQLLIQHDINPTYRKYERLGEITPTALDR